MEDFNIKGAIVKLVKSNKKGVTKQNVIDYLDYINKIRYSDNEIDLLLEDLKQEEIIKCENELWFIGS